MMDKSLARTTTIEVHIAGQWVPAGELQALGDDRCRFEYLPDYIFRTHPVPVAMGLPVEFQPERMVEGPSGLEPDRAPPSFLYDLVPQGRGRRFLVETLGLTDSDRLILPLLMAGAFNPIGHLRLSSAVEFYQQQAQKNPSGNDTAGFALSDIVQRSDEYLQHIALHAMLASGTTGVQGVAPKFLLATDSQGRWHADLALDDRQAQQHWLLKLPRGKAEEDRAVLRNEAAYLRVARACGLRVHAEPMLEGDMLFLRRFDRVVANGVVYRLAQESLASVAGLRGFGAPVSQQTLLAALREVVDDPLVETIEFMKRDVLNLALRNTDNHARNSAVQRLADGRIQLTPLYDFAPMFMDPEVVPRSVQWRDAAGVTQSGWRQIIEALDIDEVQRLEVARALHAFAETVGMLPQTAMDCGIEPQVLEACRRTIDAQAEQLVALQDLVDRQGLGIPRHG